MFPEAEPGNKFKEPPVLNGKQRWQIIQLLKEENASRNKVDQPGDDSSKNAASDVRLTSASSTDELLAGSSTDVIQREKEKSKEEGREDGASARVVEIVYQKGVYLPEDASLKDLRNAFIDSRQLDSSDGAAFQFLHADVPGEAFLIDVEEDTLLSQIHDSLADKQTVYIETINLGMRSAAYNYLLIDIINTVGSSNK